MENLTCARVDQLLILGMVIPTLIGNAYNGYIKPYRDRMQAPGLTFRTRSYPSIVRSRSTSRPRRSQLTSLQHSVSQMLHRTGIFPHMFNLRFIVNVGRVYRYTIHWILWVCESGLSWVSDEQSWAMEDHFPSKMTSKWATRWGWASTSCGQSDFCWVAWPIMQQAQYRHWHSQCAIVQLFNPAIWALSRLWLKALDHHLPGFVTIPSASQIFLHSNLMSSNWPKKQKKNSYCRWFHTSLCATPTCGDDPIWLTTQRLQGMYWILYPARMQVASEGLGWNFHYKCFMSSLWRRTLASWKGGLVPNCIKYQIF